jgi:protein involved in polysaccharide export with SLBB domain
MGKFALVPLLAVLGGCTLLNPRVDQALLARGGEPASVAADGYAVRCPDVVEVRVPGRPQWSGQFVVGVDGRLDLGPDVQPRVEGLTPALAAREVADAAGLEGGVELQVVGYYSQQVYLHGEVRGQARAVPYHGPETVLELLQRTGGITSGAAPGDVQVVRSHVAEGGKPELFEVDLSAILIGQDPSSNVRLHPFDQVYVGQSKRSSLLKCLPPWARPLYARLCGLTRPPRSRAVIIVDSPQ